MPAQTADQMVLSQLRSTVLAAMPDAEWREVEEEVRRAGIVDCAPVTRAVLRKAATELRARIAKGDFPGHPFRGNQWVTADGASRGGGAARQGGEPTSGRTGMSAADRGAAYAAAKPYDIAVLGAVQIGTEDEISHARGRQAGAQAIVRAESRGEALLILDRIGLDRNSDDPTVVQAAVDQAEGANAVFEARFGMSAEQVDRSAPEPAAGPTELSKDERADLQRTWAAQIRDSGVDRGAQYLLGEYTGRLHERINAELRRGELSADTAQLVEAFPRMTVPAPRAMTVHRGLDARNGLPDWLTTAASEFVDPAFSSTSMSWQTAKSFADGGKVGRRPWSSTTMMMEIRIPKGHPVANPQTIGNSGEQEILLGPGTRYRVVEVQTTTQAYGERLTTVVVEVVG